ncbi:hypothetical protein SNE40_016881 [Patella caerulea]|uniref:C-type lectin domain-containing protein n=1 Tax=Patella caerulea TaxID=87958 RepID=A0AAN8PD14_PATCE
MVEGRCVYGFSVGYQYNDAKSLCESEGTQLVTLQSEQKQEAVWTALGSNFGQHWMGLIKTDGAWQWQENGVLIDVTSTRWENVQSSNNVAYTMSSQDRYLWKMTNTDSWYKPVCEDVSDTSSSAISVSDTETSTVASTTATPGKCTTLSYICLHPVTIRPNSK